MTRMTKRIISEIIILTLFVGISVLTSGCSKQSDDSIGKENDTVYDVNDPNQSDGRTDQEWPDGQQDGNRPELPDDGNPPELPDDGNRPARPDDGKMPGQPDDGNPPEMPNDGNRPGVPPEFPGEQGGEVTYTPLDFDKDDLFSDRDLEGKPELAGAVAIQAKDSEIYTIDTAGIYVLSGEANDFSVVVDAAAKDKVQIVLAGAKIRNSDFPIIYAKEADKCFVTLSGENELAVDGTFRSDGDVNTDAVIFAKCDLTLNGDGALTVRSASGNGITSKDDLCITGGTYNIVSGKHGLEANDSVSIAAGSFAIDAGKDGIHCANDEQEGFIYLAGGSFQIDADSDGIQATSYLVADGGEYRITAAEGLEATYVQINDGRFSIQASDDGVNASSKCPDYDVVIEINGGELTIEMGPGDTDGLDANGIIVVNGGTIDVSGGSTFDYDRGAIYTGGTIIVNGTTVDEIPEPTMGAGPGGRGRGWGRR